MPFQIHPPEELACKKHNNNVWLLGFTSTRELGNRTLGYNKIETRPLQAHSEKNKNEIESQVSGTETMYFCWTHNFLFSG